MAKNSGPVRTVHARTTGKERDEMIATTKAEIEKKFGQGSIMRYGDGGPELEVEAIPTGALALDAALGIGGVPRGRIVEIYGPESSGKTTLSLEIVDMLVRSGAIDAIVVDSVAALTPRAEIEGEIGDTTVGLQARLMSQALRKLAGSLSKSNTTCIFINQLREKIGVMFGNPETTTGGRALKFFSSVRIDIRRIDSIKLKDEVIGNRVRAKVVKNKVAAPFRSAEFDIMYGTGISKEGSILDMAVECGICKKMGSWFAYGEDKLGNGREAAKAFLREHPDCADEIEHKVRLACGLEFDDDAPSEVELTDQPAPEEFDELYAIDGSAMLDDDDE